MDYTLLYYAPKGLSIDENARGVSIPHALSEIFRCVAAGDTLKFYLLISNFYLLDVAVRPHQNARAGVTPLLYPAFRISCARRA